ncbi:MAG: hypothetical protein IJI97_10580 [Clostridia bacterium]|nr:hypothetical protein [Clostridia bacterium]
MTNGNGTTIARAYVQIMPSAEGIQGQLTDVLSGPLDEVGKSAGANLGGAIKGGLVTATKVGTAALAAAAGGVTALTKQAVDGFADYEQLVGGVETLFKDSAGQVQQYAAEAFRTAGLSANQYRETVTSFSASLLQSLGGDTRAAADMADLAITDMSDNANKMGSDMASIQNAYQGFAKQNYSMLDNLKLGYGGTSEEMFRLMSDAAALNEEFAKTAEFSIDAKGHLTAGYADIVKAIHIVQTEMGITGTTAEEAAKTVSGSLGMLKGAWANLVTGMADPAADLDKLIADVVESAGTAAENLVPVIEHALTGLAGVVEKLTPIIAERLPGLVEKLLPPLLHAATTLVTGLIRALPQIVQALIDEGPAIVKELWAAIVETAPILADAAGQLVQKLADYILEHSGELGASAGQLIVRLGKFLLTHLPQLAEIALKLVGGLAMFLVSAGAELIKAGAGLAAKLGEGIKNALREAFQWGRDLISNFISGIKDKLADLWQSLKDVAGGVKKILGFSKPELGPLSDFDSYAPDMMDLYARGIRENKYKVTDAIREGLDIAPSLAVGIAARNAPQGGWQEVRRSEDAGTTVSAVMVCDDVVFGRLIFNLNKKEAQRMGVDLVGGGAA